MSNTLSFLTIREANAEDADEVATVFQAAFAPLRAIYRPNSKTVARQSLHHREGTRLVAELDQQVVATVQFDSHEDFLSLLGLAVHPHFQRKGIARGLLDWINSHALATGRTAITLQTIRQTASVPLFEKLGFRVIGERVTDGFESDIHTELHEVKMLRSISASNGTIPRRLP
ncbi:GNAT family N-acetyltransferase [Novipirellula caenicola]|uniref:N-acetyltransferase domain-containing protein n=1 Tax=Novipirellula caenicola TaxID=1536901 RepID=A0ABP9W0B2_9BACT